MNFTGFDAVFLTLTFLVPGFILNAVFERFCPQETAETQVLFLRFLTFSCINYGAWLWLVYLLIRTDFFYKNLIAAAFGWTVVTLISPVVLGICFGLIEQKKVIAKVFKPIAFIHPIEDSTAWDEATGRITPHPLWVLVTMRNGNKVYGLFGSNSYATSKNKGGDVFIEKCASPGWVVDENQGIWIRGSEIISIEFW